MTFWRCSSVSMCEAMVLRAAQSANDGVFRDGATLCLDEAIEEWVAPRSFGAQEPTSSHFPLGRKPFPVPLGDDLDASVHHFEGGLIVNRVRRPLDAGRP